MLPWRTGRAGDGNKGARAVAEDRKPPRRVSRHEHGRDGHRLRWTLLEPPDLWEYDDDTIAELTMIIAWENASSHFNRAFRIPSQGFWKPA
jgi:hypothetical protein